MSETKNPPSSSSGLPHEKTGLTLLQAVAVGVNNTSPAYSLASILGPMVALVGYAAPLVLILSFLPMALTSLAFLYLNRRDPDCGTTFSWVTRAIGVNSGFVSGWVIAACSVLLTGSLAETSVTYGLHLFGQAALAENHAVVIVGAAILIMVMVVLAITLAESSIKLQSTLTYLQVGILIVFGILAIHTAWKNGIPSFTGDWLNPLHNGIQPLVASMLLGVFAFWGWEAATNLAEECRNPSDGGKAGFLSTIILVGTYTLVAVSVVLFMGKTNFGSVNSSQLVLIDMAGPVLGPLSFLILLAVSTSALASTQLSLVPGSRAVLSMARRGALPAKLGLMHPRFKTPHVSLLVLSLMAVGFYVVVSAISKSAIIDTLSSLGILVAFFYGATGLSCVLYYRKHVVRSLRGFLLVGVAPLIGSLVLFGMLFLSIYSLWDPGKSAIGTPLLGLSPPLTIAAMVFTAGIVVLVIRRKVSPGFFHSELPKAANILESPFMLDTEKTVPHGGIVVDCNDPIEEVIGIIDRMATPDLDRGTPLYLVFGVEPAELSGDEYNTAMEALASDADRQFTTLGRMLKGMGFRSVFSFYDNSHARESVLHVSKRLQARGTWSTRHADDTDHRAGSNS
jgi:amino acid transporter